MTKKKIMLVFGTRPEAIKMAPLVHALKASPDYFEVLVCVTAQHRQMLDQVLNVFDVSPDIDLNVMKSAQNLSQITAIVLQGMQEELTNNKPDLVLVHGDTTTTLATAMAAFYVGIAVAHIEAGLRTRNLYAPFPEEFNRQVVSKIARWHFAPTTLSRNNLLSDGVPSEKIIVTGNTVIDALHWILGKIESDAVRSESLSVFLRSMLSFAWQNSRFVLVTGHRRENFGDGFLQICKAIRNLASRFSEVHFVYPLHLNPNVQQPVRSLLSELNNVHLIEPLDYEPFAQLLKHCYIVLTDSGGIQEEAPSLGKPVLVMRDVTERPEAVLAGTVELVGADEQRISNAVALLLTDENHHRAMSTAHNPYGDGKACTRIVNSLLST